MKKQAILFGLVLFVGLVFGWRSFKVVFTSFPFEANKDKVEVKLEIRNDTGETTINCHFNVIEQLDDLYLTYAISLDNGEGNYTTLINRSTNFCKFLTTKASEPILKVIYDDLLKHGNFFKACPLKKGIYYLHDYRIDEEMLPSYVPETTLAVDIVFTLPSKEQLFKGKLLGKIDKSKGFNNLKIFSLG
ncbi:uncharacterized protein LOC129919376 [Episyrphus balteatus]|uniref:uncharacterized protein LOC129919376 n=1 Tax=Episyrphus balteatus TaxID=286459 RepID=UPI0024864FE5|nr:uncharacterized protein LOC129919376 [Episyrphus balteatus]